MQFNVPTFYRWFIVQATHRGLRVRYFVLQYKRLLKLLQSTRPRKWQIRLTSRCMIFLECGSEALVPPVPTTALARVHTCVSASNSMIIEVPAEELGNHDLLRQRLYKLLVRQVLALEYPKDVHSEPSLKICRCELHYHLSRQICLY